jgi:hypothetical protein
MATTTPSRLSDVAPAGGELTAMADIEQKDLLLEGAEETETQFGRGYRLTLKEVDGSDVYEVLTNAVVVVKQIDQAFAMNCKFPHLVRFQKQGKCWIIV